MTQTPTPGSRPGEAPPPWAAELLDRRSRPADAVLTVVGAALLLIGLVVALWTLAEIGDEFGEGFGVIETALAMIPGVFYSFIGLTMMMTGVIVRRLDTLITR